MLGVYLLKRQMAAGYYDFSTSRPESAKSCDCGSLQFETSSKGQININTDVQLHLISSLDIYSRQQTDPLYVNFRFPASTPFD